MAQTAITKSSPRRQQLLVIGQFIFWLGISFLTCFLLLRQPPQPRNDHQRDEYITPWQQTVRQQQPSYDREQVETELSQLAQSLRGGEHFAPDETTHSATEKLDNLCSSYPEICERTSREGTYTQVDQYLYQATAIILITTIDKGLKTPKSLYDTLSYLKVYQHPKDRRGSSGHTQVKVNTEKIPDLREYREVLSHEFGHTIDLGILYGNGRYKNKAFTEFGKIIRPNDDPSLPFYKISRTNETTRKADASFQDFVSGYGMKGVYEDFAETNNMRLNHNALFRSLAGTNTVLAQKYKFFQKLYGTERFDDDEDMLPARSTEARVRDSTRIRAS